MKYAQRARKIKNKPIINTIDVQSLKMLTMKQKIEELENKLENISSNDDTNENDENNDDNNYNVNEYHTDEEWMKHFINEFKHRTIKGSSKKRKIKKKEINIYILAIFKKNLNNLMIYLCKRILKALQ